MSEKDKKKKGIGWKFPLIIILILGGMIVWLGYGKNGLIHVYRTEIELRAYTERIRQLTDENKALMEEIERLRKDMAYVESVVRENLNMIKSNEIIYRFDNENRRDRDPAESINREGQGDQNQREK